MQVISIDYDDTYTSHPKVWDEIIQLLKSTGHIVVCVTARMEDDIDDVKENLKGIEIFATNGKDKHQHMVASGLTVDIWIDDMPWLIGKPH